MKNITMSFILTITAITIILTSAAVLGFIYLDMENLKNDYNNKDRLVLSMIYEALKEPVETNNKKQIEIIFKKIMEYSDIFALSIYQQKDSDISVLYSQHRMMPCEECTDSNPVSFTEKYEYPIQSAEKFKLKDKKIGWVTLFPTKGRVEKRQIEIATKFIIVGGILIFIESILAIILMLAYIKRPLKKLKKQCYEIEKQNFNNPVEQIKQKELTVVSLLLERFRQTAHIFINGFYEFTNKLQNLYNLTEEDKVYEEFLSLTIEFTDAKGGEIYSIDNDVTKLELFLGLSAHDLFPADEEPISKDIIDIIKKKKNHIIYQANDEKHEIYPFIRNNEKDIPIMFIPILHGDKLVGIIKLSDKKFKNEKHTNYNQVLFTKSDALFVSSLMSILALKIRKIKSKNKYEKLRNIANKFKKSIKFFKDSKKHFDNSDLDKSLDSLLKSINNLSYNKLIKRIGILFIKRKEYEKAYIFLRAAIELDEKKNMNLYYPCILSLCKIGEFTTAKRLSEFAITKDTENLKLLKLHRSINKRMLSFLDVERLKTKE